VAIHDAIKAIEAPTIEVHISNIFARESWRRRSYVAPVARGSLCGFGIDGYALAITGLAAIIGAPVKG
jgi:3-dehydroquinate dehydratase-2